MKQMLVSIAALIGLFIMSIVYFSLDPNENKHVQIEALTSFNTDSNLKQ